MIRRRTLLAAAGGTLLGSALATGTARADATIVCPYDVSRLDVNELRLADQLGEDAPG